MIAITVSNAGRASAPRNRETEAEGKSASEEKKGGGARMGGEGGRIEGR